MQDTADGTPALTARQEALLRLIVEDYISTAAPIASETVARNHGLGVSPATIRNEVATLEEAGYLERPHASAGAVPVDKAYRLYVESLASTGPGRARRDAVESMRRQLGEIERDVDEWASVAAAILARRVRNMAIVTFPKARESRVTHLELVPLHDLLVMLIVVLERARLRRHLIRLRQPVEPAELVESIDRVKSRLLGLNRRSIEPKEMTLTPLEEEVVDATVLMLEEEDRAIYRDHYVDGLRNLLSQPEFSANDKMHSIVEGVEEGSLIQSVLEEAPEGGVVRVIIGRENRGDVLQPLSVVICQYGIVGEAAGAVGAIGPTRMEYSKTIADVQVMSSLMSEMMESVYSR